MTKHYTKGDVTVVWKPDICQHSGICARGLHEVFNPKISPWINMDGAEVDRILDQVGKCPSGALSMEIKKGKQ